MPDRVSCVGRGGGGAFADEAHRIYYEAPPRKAVEAATRDLSKLRAMGLVAGDSAKEKILSVSPLPLSLPAYRFCGSVPLLSVLRIRVAESLNLERFSTIGHEFGGN